MGNNNWDFERGKKMKPFVIFLFPQNKIFFTPNQTISKTTTMERA
jgi:hypothetical protein